MTKCFQCRFWVSQDEKRGNCHRHAKQGASWPQTDEAEWCGDAEAGERPQKGETKRTFVGQQPTGGY